MCYFSYFDDFGDHHLAGNISTFVRYGHARLWPDGASLSRRACLPACQQVKWYQEFLRYSQVEV